MKQKFKSLRTAELEGYCHQFHLDTCVKILAAESSEFEGTL